MQRVHDVSFDEAGRRLHRSKIGKENQSIFSIFFLHNRIVFAFAQPYFSCIFLSACVHVHVVHMATVAV